MSLIIERINTEYAEILADDRDSISGIERRFNPVSVNWRGTVRRYRIPVRDLATLDTQRASERSGLISHAERSHPEN